MLGRDAEGETILHNGLKIAARSPILHYTIGLTLVRMKRKDAALAKFEQATTLDAANASFFLCLGSRLALGGQIGCGAY